MISLDNDFISFVCWIYIKSMKKHFLELWLCFLNGWNGFRFRKRVFLIRRLFPYSFWQDLGFQFLFPKIDFQKIPAIFFFFWCKFFTFRSIIHLERHYKFRIVVSEDLSFEVDLNIQVAPINMGVQSSNWRRLINLSRFQFVK